MLRITTANRLEALTGALVEALATPASASPFDAEPILVPSAAIRRHIMLALAEAHGIAAHLEFAFPAQWLWQQIGAVVPGVPERSPFAAGVLAWRVLEQFEHGEWVGAHPRLASYLAAADPVMRFELAERVAAVLEQYVTYRPDWLAAWRDGRLVVGAEIDAVAADEAWQAVLWQRLGVALALRPRDPINDFFAALEAAPSSALPPRVHVFALPSMPPLYIRMLHRLAQRIDVRVYVVNPCREYWFELVDRRTLSYLAARGRAGHHEVGNPLLANWGKQTQAHLDLLLTEVAEVEIEDRFDEEEPKSDASLLHQVQQAILTLAPLDPGSLRLAEDDRSVEVHVCHSLTRELEVLHDQILAAFAADPGLQAADVLVVTPDLDAAAPLIDAVFGNAPPERQIPYAISGVGAAAANPLAAVLLELLTLATSRLAASSAFDLLQQPIVARRFGLDGEALLQVHGWLLDAAMRWDIDGVHHRALKLPPVDRYDFRDGLERLLLGYARGTHAGVAWQAHLPAADVEGADALALGSLVHFVDALAAARDELGRRWPAARWPAVLLALTETFFDPADDEIDALRQLRGAIRELGRNLAAAQFDRALPFEVVRRALEAQLEQASGAGAPSGQVTFAPIAGLRNLPFAMICAIGIDDGVFPSAPPAVEFDLVAARPRRGDRQRRADDRNLFLDLLLASRRRFYISYRGRSIRDNAERPPSTLVAELVETLVGAIDSPLLPAELRQKLVIEHPLQPFSPKAFGRDTDVRQRSYVAEYARALIRRTQRAGLVGGVAASGADAELFNDTDEVGDLGSPRQQQACFTVPLSPPPPELREVALDGLIRFFCNPCRYLLRARLGIDWPRAAEPLPDEEPFVADFRARRRLADQLLAAHEGGADPTARDELAAAVVGYPPGSLGETARARDRASIGRYAAVRDAASIGTPGHADGSFQVEIDGESWRLTGALTSLRPSGQLLGGYHGRWPTWLVDAWIRHLFLCHLRPGGIALATRWIGSDGEYRLRACPTAAEQLRILLGHYRDGLREPLHFFPRSALAYVERDYSLRAAQAVWRSNPFWLRGEDRDPAYRLALRGIADPLDAAFERVARDVFGPLFTGRDGLLEEIER